MTHFNPETLAAALMPKQIQLDSASLSLLLYIRHNRVQVSVFDPAKQGVVWGGVFETDPLQSEWESVLEFIEARNWHRTIFGTSAVVFDNERGILTPRGLWTESLAHSVYKLECGMDLVRPNSVQIPEWDVVYTSENPQWIDTIRNLFPNALFIPLDAMLLKYARIKADKETAALTYSTGESFRIILVREGRLLLNNQYSGTSPIDFLYYLRVAAAACSVELDSLRVFFHSEKDFSFSEIGYYLPQEESWNSSGELFWEEIHRKCVS
ncbi:MAG: DUF3822 family protein [Flavobacteriales bacterium]